MKQLSTRWLASVASAALLISVGGLAARAQDTGDDTAPPPPPPPPPPAAAGPAASAPADTPPPAPGGYRRRGGGFARFRGTVATVSATGFTFTTRPGNETVTVTTGSQTTYTNTHDGTVSEIKTGDSITALGQADATAKTVQAFRIVDGVMPDMTPGRGGGRPGGPGGFGGGPGAPGGFGAFMTKGSVVSTTPLKMKDASGVVYTVTPADPSGVSFASSGSLADVKVGEYVVVRPQNTPGTPITAATTSITAQSVVISPTAPRYNGFGGGGGRRGGFGRPGGFGGGAGGGGG